MKTIYDIIKESGAEQGTDVMLETTKVISDAIEHSMPEEARNKLYAELYGQLSKGHYNEQYAHDAVKKMYYIGEDAKEHFGPYFTDQEVAEHYEKVKTHIPNYNMWDFYVTLNMKYSDNYGLVHNWWPDITKEDATEKYVEMAVNWLSDSDWKRKDKIWHYLNK